MISVEGGGSNGERPSFYIYKGYGSVPRDVTHVRVEHSVRVVRDRAFEDCRFLKVVELPKGLLKVDDLAFKGCASLERIEIPSTVAAIGPCAFNGCGKLEEVSLPRGLSRMGERAFNGCRSLRSIVGGIPPVECIDSNAFNHCENLTEVSLSEGIREIKSGAFMGCKSLRSIRLPSSLRAVGEFAFHGCTGVTEVILPDQLNTIGRGSFECCDLQNFRVPTSMKRVRTDMFCNLCRGLVSVEIPRSVEEIKGEHCNDGLKHLRNVALPPDCRVDSPTLDKCFDLKQVLRHSGDSTSISNLLRHRFDGLPVHELCYYQSHEPTESVLNDLRQEIKQSNSTETWERQDCLGMTPLHILACSTKHDNEMIELLVRQYPEALIMEDKWGGIPLMYALWCNTPKDITQFLVESHRRLYPDHEVNWHCMIVAFTKSHVPAANISHLLDVQRDSFPDQSCDLQATVMELVQWELTELDSKHPGLEFLEAIIPEDYLRLLLQSSIAGRLELLKVRKWRGEIETLVNETPVPEVAGLRYSFLGRNKETEPKLRYQHVRDMYARLASYELLKEATSLLELVLWKAKIDERRNARDDDAIHHREQCRIRCGAETVIQNVFPFLH